MNSNRMQKAGRAATFRVIAIGVVLYWLMQTVVAYFKGGPDAPDLTLLLISIVVLGGGAVLVGVMTWKTWQAEKRLAELEAQEAAEEAAGLEAIEAAEEE